MARHNDDRSRLLQILEDTPFLNAACKKVGISRATVYRWMKSNSDFKKKVRKALSEGRRNTVEVAEVMLVKKVRDGDMNAIKFLLQFNSKKYRPTRASPPPPLVSPEQWETFAEFYVNLRRNQPIPREKMQEILQVWKNFGYIDTEGKPTMKLNEMLKSVTDNIGDVDPKKTFDAINEREWKHRNSHLDPADQDSDLTDPD